MAPQPFPIIQSAVDSRRPEFQANRDKWTTIIDELEANLCQVASEGNEASLNKHQQRGQLLPRDRINLLLDADSPFLELYSFAGFRQPLSNACANLIAGIGLVRYNSLSAMIY
ncbi:hypothetical protein NW764_015922 [Fusarium oxysporum]|nr:hypothetical protein NW764_015922 [Fusarium oxysporum]